MQRFFFLIVQYSCALLKDTLLPDKKIMIKEPHSSFLVTSASNIDNTVVSPSFWLWFIAKVCVSSMISSKIYWLGRAKIF